MGKNKKQRKKLTGYQKALAKHHEKIAQALQKANPDFDLIGHWNSEIRGLEKTISRILKRLPGGKRWFKNEALRSCAALQECCGASFPIRLDTCSLLLSGSSKRLKARMLMKSSRLSWRSRLPKCVLMPPVWSVPSRLLTTPCRMTMSNNPQFRASRKTHERLSHLGVKDTGVLLARGALDRELAA